MSEDIVIASRSEARLFIILARYFQVEGEPVSAVRRHVDAPVAAVIDAGHLANIMDFQWC